MKRYSSYKQRHIIFALKGVGTYGHYRSNKRAKEYQGF